MISLVVPVYKNSGNISPLIEAVEKLNQGLGGQLEAVFVVDGSPDDSYQRLATTLPGASFRSQLLLLSRNFGSFSAIRAGLQAGEGEHFAVMAADLQEPPELILEFASKLTAGEADVVIGRRVARSDPFFSRLASNIFWATYRRLVMPQVPPGGVDVFGCTREVRDHILALTEQNSSLVGLLFWVGYRRAEVAYARQARTIGKSAWTLSKKIRYLSDNIYSFTDLPIRVLGVVGGLGLVLSILFGTMVFVLRLAGLITVPGYAATVLLVAFFGTLNCLGLAIIGGYLWRTFENTKNRPGFIVASRVGYPRPRFDAGTATESARPRPLSESGVGRR
jgi:glycosyltransferase involved in cell wall biosynthesis